VDRLKLKSKLIASCQDSGVEFHLGKVQACHHGARSSTIECSDGLEITGRFIVDATGHARRLTEMDGKHDPGFQAAYGIMAGVYASCPVLQRSAAAVLQM
jgi:flavin-dependent dehydrogenase